MTGTPNQQDGHRVQCPLPVCTYHSSPMLRHEREQHLGHFLHHISIVDGKISSQRRHGCFEARNHSRPSVSQKGLTRSSRQIQHGVVRQSTAHSAGNRGHGGRIPKRLCCGGRRGLSPVSRLRCRCGRLPLLRISIVSTRVSPRIRLLLLPARSVVLRIAVAAAALRAISRCCRLCILLLLSIVKTIATLCRRSGCLLIVRHGGDGARPRVTRGKQCARAMRSNAPAVIVAGTIVLLSTGFV